MSKKIHFSLLHFDKTKLINLPLPALATIPYLLSTLLTAGLGCRFCVCFHAKRKIFSYSCKFSVVESPNFFYFHFMIRKVICFLILSAAHFQHSVNPDLKMRRGKFTEEFSLQKKTKNEEAGKNT